MERRRKLDVTRAASGGKTLSRACLPLLLLWLLLSIGLASPLLGQVSSTPDSPAEKAKQLAAGQRWQEIVSLAESAPEPSPELDYYHGVALAHLERWDDARNALRRGARLRPGDERFPVELAGVAFKQKRYSEAARFLRRALKIAPGDRYATEFLATVYFLQGNLTLP